jgi:hypothetical protein
VLSAPEYISLEYVCDHFPSPDRPKRERAPAAFYYLLIVRFYSAQKLTIRSHKFKCAYNIFAAVINASSGGEMNLSRSLAKQQQRAHPEFLLGARRERAPESNVGVIKN